MSALLTSAALLFVLTAFFWASTLLLHNWLYSTPPERVGVRALAAAAVLTLFLSFWTLLDRKNPGRYDTFFDFTAYDIQDFDTFEAVRARPIPGDPPTFGPEQVVTYRRPTRGRRPSEYRPEEYRVLRPQDITKGKEKDAVASGDPFNRAGTETMVIALRVPMPDAEPLRLDAVDLIRPGRDGKPRIAFNDPQVYREAGGAGRYMTDGTVGKLFIPRGGLLFVNLLLNALVFVLWFAALWLGMRYAVGHALVGTFGLGLMTTLVLIPLLLQLNRPRPVAVESVAPLVPAAEGKK